LNTSSSLVVVGEVLILVVVAVRVAIEPTIHRQGQPQHQKFLVAAALLNLLLPQHLEPLTQLR
jgi:hypothetical protein